MLIYDVKAMIDSTTWPGALVLMIFYALASAPFTYIFSTFFSSHTSAQNAV